MSEFRIVKCKKCDAALTELAGEKLTSCVQCGYNFTLTSKNSKISQLTSGDIKDTPEIRDLVNKLRGIKNDRLNESNQPKSSTTNTTQTTKSKKTKKATFTKKKSNPIGTIIVWIIIFNIVRSIFFN